MPVTTLYDFQARRLDGSPCSLADFRGKVLLIVNTASACGYTPQYKGLQALHERYGPRGFAVLGFPCNQFGKQEPGTASEIAGFCESNYGVGFPLFEKIDVNGSDAHPLFEHLKKAAPGILGTEAIKWNFTKFLVGPDGTVKKRYAPKDEPADIAPDIEGLLPA
jgi:glutathione peroxidase